MSAEIIPFDFEEQAVRVLMRDGEPWFVAADVCRVLEINNTSDAIKRLDDDEFTLDTIEGSHRQTNIINESGLYALVLTSRKEQAKRFRKWITSEVLPAIRKHGRYEHRIPASRESGDIAGVPIREAELWLQMVREARLSRGTRAAVSVWDRSPLPPISPGAALAVDPEEGRAALAYLLDQVGDAVDQARNGDAQANTDLGASGLRARDDGLFVANFQLDLFRNSRWGGGAHKAALLSLSGVFVPATSYSLARVSTRGLVLPWARIDEKGVHEMDTLGGGC